MERELSVTLLPGTGQALRAYSALGDQSKTKRDTTTSRQLVMQLCDLIALRLSGRSGPQVTLGQPRMAAHILLIFGACLLLHQLYILPERHHLSIQASL